MASDKPWSLKPLLALGEVNKARYIRTLTLNLAPHCKDMPLECGLEVTLLDKCSDYVAMSYAWGEEPACVTIWVGGYLVKVSPTLRSALIRIRDHWNERHPSCTQLQELRLWVDALCINQNNQEEKNEQVRMMSDVYANAQSMIIWLGEHDPLVRSVPSSQSRLPTTSDLQDQLKSTQFLESMLSAGWFERLWPVQELLSQEQRYIAFGPYLFSFYMLVEAISTQQIKRSQAQVLVPSSWRLNRLLERKPLLYNILEFARKRCSDSRDRTYALLGISCDVEDFFVDYKEKTDMMFRRLTAKYILSKWLPAILVAAQSVERCLRHSRSPSWSFPPIQASTCDNPALARYEYPGHKPFQTGACDVKAHLPAYVNEQLNQYADKERERDMDFFLRNFDRYHCDTESFPATIQDQVLVIENAQIATECKHSRQSNSRKLNCLYCQFGRRRFSWSIKQSEVAEHVCLIIAEAPALFALSETDQGGQVSHSQKCYKLRQVVLLSSLTIARRCTNLANERLVVASARVKGFDVEFKPLEMVSRTVHLV